MPDDCPDDPTISLPAPPKWPDLAEAVRRLGLTVEVALDCPPSPAGLHAFVDEREAVRALVLHGADYDRLAPTLAAHAEGGLGGRLLVVCGPSERLGRLPFPVFVPADAAEAVRLLPQALALSEEFTTPVCLALAGTGGACLVPERVAALLAGLPPAVPQPEAAVARAVALANHVEGLGAWRLQRSGDRRLGLICAGPGWHLARRRYPQARCLRLDLAWPLPLKTIKGVVAVSALTCWVPGGGDWVPAALAEEGIVLQCGEIPPFAAGRESRGKVG
ncbi:hypothetical protein [Oryzomicrobium sp.]|uniref:hypothetical protein n=1 Tax=Oryzomicrobium sp. TaxID=1911578 RepID=UPI0025F7B8E3|nr:hypothetical protein [Oryzomicrobium sp.]MCE1244921.1 hypothetical protein [Oryzomicrobium sp.]